MTRSYISYIFVNILISTIYCSESLLGASITWRPSTEWDDEIDFSFQIAWKQSATSVCTDRIIREKWLRKTNTDFDCIEGCYEEVSDLYFYCTDYSVSEDWTQGVNSFEFEMPRQRSFYLFILEDCCWLTLDNGGNSKRFSMIANATTTIREDIGEMNSAPITSSPVFLNLPYGCNHTIRIPVMDIDGDNVKCRFATSARECGYICAGLQNAHLDRDKCTVNYNAVYGLGRFGVHVQIEDFSISQPSTPLSSAPIQFIVNVFNDSLPCNSGPVFVSPTPQDGVCVSVISQFEQIIVARTAFSTQIITDIHIQGPLGMEKSVMGPYGTSGREWYINITWTPTASQDGIHLFCYSAIADRKFSSVTECISIRVGPIPTINLTNRTLWPTGEIHPSVKTFTLRFNNRFMRPSSSKFLYIYESSGVLVHQINVSDPTIGSYPSDGLSSELIVTHSFTYSEFRTTYFILADEGVADGFHKCTLAWRGIQDPSFWTFTTLDVIPPSLTFDLRPLQSLNDILITWSTSEPVNTTCILFLPAGPFHQTCRGFWNGTHLPGGQLSLSVLIKDGGGNIAGPFNHTWINVDDIQPFVTFIKKPMITLSNASISWSESEVTTSSQCIITTPYEIIKANCSKSWDGTDLTQGNYSISINLTDTSGNTGGPFIHNWFNRDITPPSITFNRLNRFSNGNVTVSWEKSENVTSNCIIQTPVQLLNISCTDKWSGINLRRGYFSMKLELMDMFGNKATTETIEWEVVDEMIFHVIIIINGGENVTNITGWNVSYDEVKRINHGALEQLYASVEKFKSVFIVNVSKGQDGLVLEHEVIIGSLTPIDATKNLAKTLSDLSNGFIKLNFNGKRVPAAQIQLKKSSNKYVTLNRRASACEIYQVFVNCTQWEYCDEKEIQCRQDGARSGKLWLILGVGGGACLLIVTGIISCLVVYLFKRRGKRNNTPEKKEDDSNGIILEEIGGLGHI